MNDDTLTADDAIAAALARNWKNAIRINIALTKQFPQDTENFTRLGFAYMQHGQFSLSKQAFQKALKLDPYNQIAERNLKRLGSLKLKDIEKDALSTGSPLMFIEEPGKTKIVACINLAPANILSRLTAGQCVHMKLKRHCIEIRGIDESYLGALPDDLSFRLIKLMDGGNLYDVYIKSVSKNNLIVFIREMVRGPKFINQPSFIASHQYMTSVPGEGKISDVPDINATSDDQTSPNEQDEVI